MLSNVILTCLLAAVCPASDSGDAAARRPDDKRPHVVLVSFDDEYQSSKTLPQFAQQLHERFGVVGTVLVGNAQDGFRGLVDELKTADALVVFVRRKALPQPQLDAIRAHLDAGKPLVALRTASHAFAVGGKLPPGTAVWPSFDPDVLGGSYHGHYGHGHATQVSLAPQAAGHPILAGVKIEGWASMGSLYKTSPVKKDATVLLMGTWEKSTEPLAWTRQYGTARVFYTSLGHPDDFRSPQFTQLLTNALFWAMDRRVPASAK